MATKKKPEKKKQNPEELFTRHLSRCLHYLAMDELPDDPAHHRTPSSKQRWVPPRRLSAPC